jgi:DNA repair protein RadA/Sms
MVKNKQVFVCTECDSQYHQWHGQCRKCNTWNSLSEYSKINKKKNVTHNNKVILNLQDLMNKEYSSINKILTHNVEIDRAFGNGLTIGSVTLLVGEPGIGKSTFLLNICSLLCRHLVNKKVLYVSGEENELQIVDRCKRLKINHPNLYIINENNWKEIELAIESMKPSFLILDSIQTVYSDDLNGQNGSLAQIKGLTFEFVNMAKKLSITSFIIGHVTKDGNASGPKTLEHMVDTVVYFEGDPQKKIRTLRPVKNRFGATNICGILEMNENGIAEISKFKNLECPSLYLKNCFGRIISPSYYSGRIFMTEVQTLVIENQYGPGKRSVQNFELNRLVLLVAVIEKYLKINLSQLDIYLNIISTIKLKDRSIDLAIIMSILSSYYKKALSPKIGVIGEVGLIGEVRKVKNLKELIKSCERLGFEKMIIPTLEREDVKKPKSYKIMQIDRLKQVQNMFISTK